MGEPDIDKIRDMVIYLGHYKRAKMADSEHHYTCRHHDAATGNCLDYENRPRMCSSFPNDRPCPYPGCTNHEELRPDMPLKRLRVGKHGASLLWLREFRNEPSTKLAANTEAQKAEP